MSGSSIDYDALAQQHGGAAAVDYDALASQHGGSASTTSSAPDTRNAVQRGYDAIQSADLPGSALDFGPGGRGLLKLGQGALDTVAPLMHPIQTLQSVFQHPGQTAYGMTTPGMASGLLKNAVTDPVRTAGQLAAGAMEGEAAGAVAKPVLGSIGDAAAGAKASLRPTPSPSVVAPAEMAARNLASAILPATKDASNFIKAAQQEVPNVIDYAKRTGNPLNTQIEFAKAAQGYAKEVRSVYSDQILGPNKDALVKTSGTGFGSQMNEGPDTYATLGEIDKRITDINTQLDKPSLNSDDARRALASKAGLQQEASGLRDILHQSLSNATGVPPDLIADIRQRVGRSYELANDTDAAVTQRSQNSGKSAQSTVPTGLSQLPSRAVDFARGGPVPIADRAFQRAIADFPGASQPLPAVPSSAPPASSPRTQALLDEALQRQADMRKRFAQAKAAAGTPPPQPYGLLPAQTGAPSVTPFHSPMTPGEQTAALMQYLRQRQQLSLPAQAVPIQLPPGQ